MPRTQSTEQVALLDKAATGRYGTIGRADVRITWSALASVSAGGALGALARYGITTAWPAAPDGFPWATFCINVTGCLMIGILVVVAGDIWPGRKLLRAFLGTGVLGGYTTFSTYIVDAQHLLDHGAALTALIYMTATVMCALVAVWIGTRICRAGIAVARRMKGATT